MIFDVTLTLGDVITVCGVLFAAAGLAFKVKEAHKKAESTAGDVAEIKEQLVQLSVFQGKLADGKARMDRIDNDLLELRKSVTSFRDEYHAQQVILAGDLAAIKAAVSKDEH